LLDDVIYATQSEGMGDQARIKKGNGVFCSQCVRVISCSEYSAKAFCELYGYPMERVSRHWLGVDQKYSPALAPQAAGFATLFLGCLVQHHPQEHAAPHSGLFRYAQSGGAYDLTLAWTLPDDSAGGGGAGGACPSCPCLGKVSEDRLIDLYQHTVCVMFPSLYEGFGFPVLEALACGVPVMTTRRSSLPEVGGDIPVYVDGEDVDEMAQVMWAFERGDMAGVASRTRVEGPGVRPSSPGGAAPNRRWRPIFGLCRIEGKALAASEAGARRVEQDSGRFRRARSPGRLAAAKAIPRTW
jgi:hypothetical protein